MSKSISVNVWTLTYCAIGIAGLTISALVVAGLAVESWALVGLIALGAAAVMHLNQRVERALQRAGGSNAARLIERQVLAHRYGPRAASEAGE